MPDGIRRFPAGQIRRMDEGVQVSQLEVVYFQYPQRVASCGNFFILFLRGIVGGCGGAEPRPKVIDNFCMFECLFSEL
jgi:hypothetical protein